MKKMMKKFAALIAVTALVLTGCATKPTTNEKIQVVTTAFALEYFIQEIAGDLVDVTFSLEGNPHHFELTQAQASTIMQADMFINIDVGDYRAIGKQILNVKKDLETVDISKGVTLLESDHVHTHDHDDEHDHAEDETHEHADEASHEHTETEQDYDQKDPHIWLDPVSAQILVENITAALVAKDTANSTTYQENAKKLIDKLIALDTAAEAKFEKLEHRNLLVGHGAYAYLAERYHLQQKSINSSSDHSENTQQSIIELDKYIDEHNIKTVFVEKNMEANNVITTLITEKKLQEDFLYNLETKINADDDYFTLMEANIEAISKGL